MEAVFSAMTGSIVRALNCGELLGSTSVSPEILGSGGVSACCGSRLQPEKRTIVAARRARIGEALLQYLTRFRIKESSWGAAIWRLVTL
jgi:hypothetical protein